jgi:phospholipid/cholesterol/gamma-HCH transport system permease protein
MSAIPPTGPIASVSRDAGCVVVTLDGVWTWEQGLPDIGEIESALQASPTPTALGFRAEPIDAWDGSLLEFVLHVERLCDSRGVLFEGQGLPADLRRMWRLVKGEEADEETTPDRYLPVVASIGQFAVDWFRSLDVKLAFLGRTVPAMLRLASGRTRNVGVRLTLALQDSGAEMVPVVGLTALLLGGILTLLGAQQMEKVVGAHLLVPNLVAIVITREFGALLTGIALAGRLASAHAAEFAGMVARNDVEDLEMLGFDRFDLLVAPRVLAPMLMGPVLVFYANMLAMLGGLFVGVNLMGITSADYIDRALAALTFKHTLAGLVRGMAFGFAVGMAGSYYGLAAGTRPGAVGRAAQSAVVAAVVAVVLLDTVLTLFFKWVKL